MADAQARHPRGGVLARCRREARLFATALQFLTRVPVPASPGYDPSWLNHCVRYFPLVGAGIGLFGAGVLWAGARLWTPSIAALLAVAATAWLTVAFHEDGLADTADALFGHAGRARALEIMKDSRIGSYGAVALALVLALRAAALAGLAAQDLVLAAIALVASHALARAGAVGLMATLPYAGDAAHAKAKPLARGVRPRDAAAAWIACGILAIPPLAWTGATGAWALLAAVSGVAATTAWMRRGLVRRLGGYTGDTLGAAEQVGEVVVLLAWLAVIGR